MTDFDDTDDDFDDDDSGDDGADDGGDPTAEGLGEDFVAKGMEALQAAAEDMISAARVLLDVAEGLVRDPQAANSVLHAFGMAARAASRMATGGDPQGDRPRREDGDDDGGVRRIPVR